MVMGGTMAKSKNDILTYTGIYMDPFRMTPEQVNIEDIAHALSMMTRANGHIKHFFSVAQHSINCAVEAQERGLPQRIQLACLLHDAAESYIADVPRPVKHRLSGYAELEEHALGVVFEAFGIGRLSPDEAAALAEIDDAMLYYEFEVLKGVAISDERPYLCVAHDFAPHDVADMENRFLQIFHRLYTD